MSLTNILSSSMNRSLRICFIKCYQIFMKNQFLASLIIRTVKSFLTLLLVCLVFKQITFLREPKWLRNTSLIRPPTYFSLITGTVLHFVRTGRMCRTFMGDETPDIIRFSNGLAAGFIRDFILLKDPVLVKKVFLEADTAKPEKGYRGFKRLTGYEGSVDFLSARSHSLKAYVENRSNVYKALMKRTYDCYESIFLPTVDSFLKRLVVAMSDSKVKSGRDKDKVKVNVVDEMHLIATSLITRVAFDEHSENFDKSLFESTIWIINDTLTRPQNNNFKILDDIPIPLNYELKRKQKLLVQTIKNMIKGKQRQRESGIRGDDVINSLLDNKDNKESDILGILSIFFFASFDTTSNTMTMALNIIANNQDVQERCRNEIEDIFDLDEKLTIQKLQRLKYLKAVISETLRMFPSVPMIAREITENHGKICPRFDEKNAFGVAINLFGLHYNEQGWNEPENFVPERWLNDEFDADRDPKKRLYCPFALGKRSCMGKQFANIEMLTVLTSIIRNFDISPCLDSEIEVTEAGSLNINRDFKLQFKEIKDGFELDPTDTIDDIFTIQQVSEHDKKDDGWIAINGQVYDITTLLKDEGELKHPGGVEILLSFIGSDATDDFGFQQHSEDAIEQLKMYRIGSLKAAPPEPLPVVFRRLSSTSSTNSTLSKPATVRMRRSTTSISVSEIETIGEARRKRTTTF